MTDGGQAGSGAAGIGGATTDLVRLAQSGDRAALDELVEAYLPLIYNIVGRALNGDSDVDDLVQDTMVGIIRGLPELREPTRFRSWAVTIAYRRMQEHHRQRARYGYRTLLRRHEIEVPDPGSDFAERTVTELALKGQCRELAEAARWLEGKDRQLFSLWWQETSGEMTRAELASTIDTTPAHAAVRVQRMRERLDATRVVLRALNARPRCPELSKVVRSWDGTADSRWRKRLTRHTRECVHCRQYSRDLARPEALLQGVGLVAVPAGLFANLSPAAAALKATGTVSAILHSFTGKTAVIAGATVISLGGISYPLWTGPSETTTPHAEPTTVAPRTSTMETTTPEAVATSEKPDPKKKDYAGVATADLYVAPNGDDDGTGSLDSPFATLAQAVAVVEPGQTIALRGGTYRPDEGLRIETSGTAGDRITLSAYRDEEVVLDFGEIPSDDWGITQSGDYWTIRDLEFENAPTHAYVCDSCNDNVYQRLDSHDNGSSGLTLRGDDTSQNQVLDSDFHDSGADGAGLNIMYGSGEGNLVDGVRTYGNGADGIDLGAFASPVRIRNSWSYRNTNGFTLGGGGTSLAVAHVLTDNAAWDNTGLGFNEEGNAGSVTLTRNTAFRNGNVGFYLPTSASTLTRNLASGNENETDLSPTAQTSANRWNAAAKVFESTDPSSAEGPRRQNGTRPATRFLVTGDGRGARMN